MTQASDPLIAAEVQLLNSGNSLIIKSGGEVNFETGAKLKIAGVDVTSGAGGSNVAGVAAGYKIARGRHTQAAAQDTVVSGLATVVAVVVSPESYTVNQQWFGSAIGDQAGSPAAGSFYINSYKATNHTNDTTPVAATTFSDNIVVDWIAIGT